MVKWPPSGGRNVAPSIQGAEESRVKDSRSSQRCSSGEVDVIVAPRPRCRQRWLSWPWFLRAETNRPVVDEMWAKSRRRQFGDSRGR